MSLCGRNAVQIHERGRPLNLDQLRIALKPLGEVRANDFVLPHSDQHFPPLHPALDGLVM